MKCKDCIYGESRKNYVDTHSHFHREVVLCHVLGEGPGLLLDADSTDIGCGWDQRRPNHEQTDIT